MQKVFKKRDTVRPRRISLTDSGQGVFTEDRPPDQGEEIAPDTMVVYVRRRPRKATALSAAILLAAAGLLWANALTGGRFASALFRHQEVVPAPPRLPIAFVDRAASSGLNYRWTIPNTRPHDILESIGNGCAFLDYNHDGNLDILLVGPKLALYRGDGRGHFTDVTHATGLDRFSGRFLGCAVGDYDNDGYDDLYISGYRTGLLLHNEGGKRFTDVTRRAGLKPQPWGTCCAFGNFDGSRYLDLFVCNYVDFSTAQFGKIDGPQAYRACKGVLYHNVDGRHFVDVTASWGADRSAGRGLGVAYAPIDAAGTIGLMVSNDIGLGDLFIRSGPRALKNIAVPSGVAMPPLVKYLDGRMGVDWGDYDNDGLLDLFVTTYHAEPKILLHNQGEDLFEDVGRNFSVGNVVHTLAWGCKWLDPDNSGWLDLLVSNGHITNSDYMHTPDVHYRQPTLLLHNTRGHGLTDATEQTGLDHLPPIVGRGLAIGDYDNDGRVDALVVDSEGAPLLLHNETRPVGHWLSLNLVGVHCNRDGYGAQVTVTAAGQTQTRLCHADGSYLSSSDKRVHLGLGTATVADTLLIRWPDGHIDRLQRVPADREIRIQEGSNVGLAAYKGGDSAITRNPPRLP